MGAPNLAMMPSPATSFTVPSKRCTASIMRCRAVSRSVWPASGSRSRISSGFPLRASNRKVTYVRSPSLAGFWLAVTDQLGIPFEVGKQHGDLLALALQGTVGRENFLGEIGGCIGSGVRAGVPARALG